MGALSAILYCTAAFMPFFLVPVQVSGGRKGFRAMLASAGLSALIISAWQVAMLASGSALSAGTLAIGVSAPAAMLFSLAFIAWPRLSRMDFASRSLVGAVVASVLCLPSFVAAAGDALVHDMFVAAFEKAASTMGIEALDPAMLWTIVKSGVLSSFGAILFTFLFASALIGTRFGGNGQPPAEPIADPASLPPRLSGYRVPGPLVWALLAAWAGLLANRFFPSLVLSAVALNAALALSICYAVQGLAVAGALADRAGLAPALRFIGPIVLILLIASGIAGLVAIGLLALLGTLETWIPFRAVTKGDQP